MPDRWSGRKSLEMPLKAIPLSGHTDWQAGYMTPDGVLMAGDALAAKKVWEKAGIVYNTNIPGTRRTLRNIMDMDADFVCLRIPKSSQKSRR